jgi:hypothetical protein
VYDAMEVVIAGSTRRREAEERPVKSGAKARNHQLHAYLVGEL